MKFYYNGQLVRTSKTHEYKFAVINTKTMKAWGCSKDLKGIEAQWSQLCRTLNLYKSVKNGTYRQKDRWHNTAKQIEANCIKYYGSLDEAIKLEEDRIADFKIVELEARA